MKPADNEYYAAKIILRILAVVLLLLGAHARSAAFVAIACGYWMAAANPWRYRAVINVGIVLHVLQSAQGIHTLVRDHSSLSYVQIFIPPIVLILLVTYYPSPYPVLSNALSFLLPTKMTVSWIETYPSLFKRLSGQGIIGTVEGLYYNSDAFAILQEEGFLGFISGKDVIETAKRAGVRSGTTVLDVGSGLGGPSCVLAGECGIRVTGIDLLERNVREAAAIAFSRGLGGRCTYLQSNALRLPFKNGTFDAVFGSDAWCHVPERKKLLLECRRVLRDHGTIFFHDWLMDKGDSEGFRFIYAFPPLETIESYTEKLREAGFDVVCAEKRNDSLMAHVAEIRNTLHRDKRKMIDVCGRELYDNWDIVSYYTWKMINEEKLSSGLFIAKKM